MISSIIVLSVSMWVEPGAGSAVLKLGFTKTLFPASSGIPSFSITFLIPLALLGSRAIATLETLIWTNPGYL